MTDTNNLHALSPDIIQMYEIMGVAQPKLRVSILNDLHRLFNSDTLSDFGDVSPDSEVAKLHKWMTKEKSKEDPMLNCGVSLSQNLSADATLEKIAKELNIVNELIDSGQTRDVTHDPEFFGEAF